ncbi:MerR family transcriptional regulator [Rhodanobacter glycinis]|uniref:MerR family transcriptional regulator n=1 Tax=Rhodanobacter glycinis TaxID=582702 RepID=A0A502FN63_9GAMM|nr:MerR family transcriptional regulator [Rhodanobacter glycinis]TPG10254.1 MerR family transcriptional regulator [Rhodanobacter glycinis]TPG50834.1 MerR family transcriptional regulator [Rhodanobacter glycinis]
MLLTVGELARRCGMTVRALHHYDAIGLLQPASRSGAGYRLYARADIERLHRIQALRQLGLSLTDIGTALSGPQQPLADVVDRQIAQIDRELTEAANLRERLVYLRTQLANGQSPDLADWLDTLELMTMYEKYFSPEELKALPLHTNPDVQVEWSALIGAVQSAMDRGATPEYADVQMLALRWMTMIERGTGNNPEFLMRLHAMNENEPAARAQSGITQALQAFVEASVVAARLAIFARYLDAHDMERMRANYGKQMYAWPMLIADLRKAMDENTPADDPKVQQMARRWMELFRAYAGDAPATHARIREAYAKEPDLRSGSSVDDALLGYVRDALASLAPTAH